MTEIDSNKIVQSFGTLSEAVAELQRRGEEIEQLQATIEALERQLDPKPEPEIRYNDEEGVDEILCHGKVHIEQMDFGQWWMSIDTGKEMLRINLISKAAIRCTLDRSNW